MNDVKLADGHWIAGLTDGEGCFYLAVRDRPGGHRGVQWTFKLALRDDDSGVTHHLMELLGIGRVTTKRAMSGRPSGLTQYLVDRMDEVAQLVAFFRRFPLRSKKRRDFEIWAAAFERWESVRGQTLRRRGRQNVRTNRKPWMDRPTAGEPVTRFRRVPDDLWEEMQAAKREIETVRRYEGAGTTT